MTVWKVEEDDLLIMIYEINRLGQEMAKFEPEVHSIIFSSRLAEIALNMLGINETSASLHLPGMSNDSGGFNAGPYSIIFNSIAFQNENLLREVLAGIQQYGAGWYGQNTTTATDDSTSSWEIEENHITELILELNRLGPEMAKVEGEAYGTWFSTRLPDIILDMLGLPEDYVEPWNEDDWQRISGETENPNTEKDSGENENSEKSSHPAEFIRSYYYDMFNYSAFQNRDLLKKYLRKIRERQPEFQKIKAAQAELGDKWEESDRFQESIWKSLKSSKD